MPLAFPTQGGLPVLITQAEFEACCCWRGDFFAGDVSGTPAFNFGVSVDAVRGFAYAVQTTGESGPVVRFDLTTGRVDTLPITAAYGTSLRPADGSLFAYDHRGGDSVLRRYLPHLWSPGDALPAQAVGSAVDYFSESGTYSPDLDAVLIPQSYGIYSWPATTLASPGLYDSTPTPYGVHGLSWDDGKIWWIEGDQSSGGRWKVGSSLFTTSPSSWGVDIVPLPDLGLAVLVGGSPSGAWVADIATGTILHSTGSHGFSAIGGSYRVGGTSSVVVFDIYASVIRTINASNGTFTDHPVGAKRCITGFYYKGRRLALPFSGASWGDPNCGVLVL